jgi:hypothetical protein
MLKPGASLALGAAEGYLETREKNQERDREREKEALQFYQSMLKEGWKPIDPKKGAPSGNMLHVRGFGYLEAPKIDAEKLFELQLAEQETRKVLAEAQVSVANVQLESSRLGLKAKLAELENNLLVARHNKDVRSIELTLAEIKKVAAEAQAARDERKFQQDMTKGQLQVDILKEQSKQAGFQTSRAELATEAARLKAANDAREAEGMPKLTPAEYRQGINSVDQMKIMWYNPDEYNAEMLKPMELSLLAKQAMYEPHSMHLFYVETDNKGQPTESKDMFLPRIKITKEGHPDYGEWIQLTVADVFEHLSKEPISVEQYVERLMSLPPDQIQMPTAPTGPPSKPSSPPKVPGTNKPIHPPGTPSTYGGMFNLPTGGSEPSL